MGIIQLLNILWARRLIAVACVFITVVMAAVVTMMIPPSYQAQTDLMLDPNQRNAVSEEFEMRTRLSEMLGREARLVSSNHVALQVVKDLKLAEPRTPLWRAAMDATKGRSPIDAWIAQRLLDNLYVRPQPQSSTLVIGYRAGNAGEAARMANAFAEAYLTSSLLLRIGTAERSSQMLSEQSKVIRSELDSAQRALQEYQTKHGLAGAGSIDEEEAKLSTLTNAFGQAAAALQEIKLKKSTFDEALAAGRDMASLPEVLNNGIVQGLRSELLRLNSTLAQIRNRYGDNHPDYQAAIAQRGSIERDMRNEIVKVGDALRIDYEIAQKRLVELDKALAEQKSRVVALQQRRNDYDVLYREVEQRQEMLTQLVNRTGEESVESRIASVNAMVITKAEAPAKPSFPKFELNIALAGIFGVLLGCFVAVLVELLQRRVRTVEDLAYASGAPVLLALPKRPNG